MVKLGPSGPVPAAASISLDIAAGQLFIVEGGAEPECFRVENGHSLMIAETRGRSLALEFDYPDREMKLLDDLSINAVHFDENTSDAFSQRSSKSSLLKGELTFLEVLDQKLQFQNGSRLGIDLGQGKLQALGLSDREVNAIISGSANDFRQRIGDKSQSIMPTYFDWLSNEPLARSLAAIVTFLVSLLAVVPIGKSK